LASFGRIWLLFTYHLALSGSDHLATLATSGEGRESQWLFLSIKSLSKWPNFGSGLHTNKDSWKLLTHAVKFLNFARCFEHESHRRFLEIYAQLMFVNILSRIVEIQQYFVAIYPYFLNFFNVCLF
jgi:hypothetical protein